MKRFELSLLAVMLVMLAAFGLGAASASEMTVDLPQGVKTLIEQAYPSHEIVMISGSRDDEQSAFVVLLLLRGEESDQYIIAVLEEAEGDAAYAQSGASLPMYNAPLSVAFAGDELVITCSDSMGERDTKDYFFAKSTKGIWTLTKGVAMQQPFTYGERAELEIMDGYQLFVHTDYLEYARVVDGVQASYPHLLYGKGFGSSLELEQFDGDFALSPWNFNNGLWEDFVETPLVEKGETLKEFVLLQKEVVLIVELADGMRQVKFYTWDNDKQAFGDPQKTKPAAAKLFLDTVHAGDDDLLFIIDDIYYAFDRTRDGKWYLSWMQNQISTTKLGVSYATDSFIDSSSLVAREYKCYGTHPFTDILLMDLDNLPHTADEVLAQLDTSDYVYVNNPILKIA